MIKKTFSAVVCCLATHAFSANAAVITDWDFDAAGAVAAPDNSPSPSTGSGTATTLGMNNSYNGTTSTASDDVLATAGASTGSGSYAWRIRGTPGNGYSSSAPIGSQGAEFDSSTAGYDDIAISFDVYFTTQAPAKIELEYTTDGSTWINASQLTYAANPAYILNNTTSANTVNGTYFYETGGQNFYNGISANLTGVSGANNDPNFGIRIVNAATGADDTSSSGGPYNNNSGNWRFDNVVISGDVAVPEPGTYAWATALMLVGCAGVSTFRKSGLKAAA